MDPVFIVTLGAVFATVALLSGSLASLALARTAPERKRLRQITTPRGVAPKAEKLQLSDGAANTRLKRLVSTLTGRDQGRSRLRRQLTAAGYDDAAAVAFYSATQIGLPIVFGAVTLLLLGVETGWIVAALAAFIGYSTPDLVLGHRITQRRKAIQDGLPDALDMIVVCVEAGSSLDQAILKTSTELEIALPSIARELKTVATETRAGKPRLQAFQDLAKRTGVEDIRSLVAMFIQTDRFGTSIAQHLRAHAETSRMRRRLRAEEQAGKVSVKLVFPLVLCLMPALYVVCLGPVAVKLYRTLFAN